METNLDDAVAAFCEKLTAAYVKQLGNGEYTRNLSIKHVAGDGPTYLRIAREEYHAGKLVARSAVCFVKREDGTIWKAASWKAPAKNFPRGRVYNTEDNVPSSY